MSTEARRPSYPGLTDDTGSADSAGPKPPPQPAPPAEAPKAAPPPPPPPAASARLPDAPPGDTQAGQRVPQRPGAAPRGAAPGSATAASGTTVPGDTAAPGERTPQPRPGTSATGQTPPRPAPPDGAGRDTARTGADRPSGQDAPPHRPGPPPSAGDGAPPRSPLSSYDIPLLAADDPDADSGTFALGKQAKNRKVPPGPDRAPTGDGTPAAPAPPAASPTTSTGSTAVPPPPPAPPATPHQAPAAGASDAARRTAARRAVGAVDLTPGPGAGRPFVFSARPPHYDDSTTRLRPVRDRTRRQLVATAACVVLGLGLIGGAVTGSWLTDDESVATGPAQSFSAAAGLWHNMPVDQLFPPVVQGGGAGPGGADRTWTRITVAPDSGCAHAFDPLLQKALAPVGCLRLLRATYTDATRSYVTTVGLLFTKADVAGMRALSSRFTDDKLDRRTDLMPRAYAAKDTLAAGFGDAQRASWTVSVLTDAPVVVYAVSGFADGRTVQDPQPAVDAVEPSADTAPAQAGLGFEAKGLADRVERGLRKHVGASATTGATDPEQP